MLSCSCTMATEGFTTLLHPMPTATARSTRLPGLATPPRFGRTLGPTSPRHASAQICRWHVPKGPSRTGYSHAAVRHRHGVVRQGIAGYFAVVCARCGGKDIAGIHMVGVNGIVPLEGPRDEQNKSPVTSWAWAGGQHASLRAALSFWEPPTLAAQAPEEQPATHCLGSV